MDALRYCWKVFELLMEADVCDEQHALFWEDGRLALEAVAAAMRGHVGPAREVAQSIAERWQLPL